MVTSVSFCAVLVSLYTYIFFLSNETLHLGSRLFISVKDYLIMERKIKIQHEIAIRSKNMSVLQAVLFISDCNFISTILCLQIIRKFPNQNLFKQSVFNWCMVFKKNSQVRTRTFSCNIFRSYVSTVVKNYGRCKCYCFSPFSCGISKGGVSRFKRGKKNN